MEKKNLKVFEQHTTRWRTISASSFVIDDGNLGKDGGRSRRRRKITAEDDSVASSDVMNDGSAGKAATDHAGEQRSRPRTTAAEEKREKAEEKTGEDGRRR
ncbi:hypothetical protein L484_022384 [Morus notabilis]|uniref:Uncharacterized protein n=1 Tax=Morus notabilis TaxID=981085 RepID=W9QSY1_9ROSA|nr:hypothetical protein L484_022384 [Morus notabilis]